MLSSQRFVLCPNHASFRLLTVVRKGSSGLTRKLILPRTQLLVLCSNEEDAEKFLHALGFESLDRFLESASRLLVSQP